MTGEEEICFDNGIDVRIRLLPGGTIQILDEDSETMRRWQEKWNMQIFVSVANLNTPSP